MFVKGVVACTCLRPLAWRGRPWVRRRQLPGGVRRRPHGLRFRCPVAPGSARRNRPASSNAPCLTIVRDGRHGRVDTRGVGWRGAVGRRHGGAGRRNEADGAVAMLEVVPAHEALNPDPRLINRREASGRPTRHILAGPEERFGEGVVVRHPWAAEGRGHAEPLHRGLYRRAFHRAAVVGVQDQGLVKHLSARTARSSTRAAKSAVSRSWISQPTILRLQMSTMR